MIRAGVPIAFFIAPSVIYEELKEPFQEQGWIWQSPTRGTRLKEKGPVHIA
jgi:hypothetical protein